MDRWNILENVSKVVGPNRTSQTGTGKTYTMEGFFDGKEKAGIIPRASDDIFRFIESKYVGVRSIQACVFPLTLDGQ